MKAAGKIRRGGMLSLEWAGMAPIVLLLAKIVLVAGIATECTGLVATRRWPLPRAFLLMACGGTLFYLGAVMLVVARLLA